MMTLLLRLALLVALVAPAARGAWLEGIRWFRHDQFVRVAFDLSAPTSYRVSEHLGEGYVDVIFQGDLSPRTATEITIGEQGVLAATQLRKTATSLTWRIQTQGIVRVRHMSVDEQPFKVAVDLYPGAAAPRVAADVKEKAKARPKGEPAARPEEGHGKRESKTAVVAAGKVPATAGAAALPEAAKVRIPAGKGDPSAPDQRYDGLKPDSRRRLLVGELLMQLGDSTGAMAYLEQVGQQEPSHAWTRFLMAGVVLSKGDEYRAATLLEPLRAQERWKPLLDPLLKRLHPPDERGLVPGGDIPEEDLGYFIGVLRQGAGLATRDLYAKQEPVQATSPSRGLLPGIGIGALLGLLAFAVAEARRRRQVDRMVRDRIMGMDSPRESAGQGDLGGPADYAEVSKRVREELEQVMHSENRDPHTAPSSSSLSLDAVPEPRAASDSLEERVYRLADQKKSIVEIAEELNLGVDEVRLHLELREQAGRIANA